MEGAVNHIGYCPTETRSSNLHDDSFLVLTVEASGGVAVRLLGNDSSVILCGFRNASELENEFA